MNFLLCLAAIFECVGCSKKLYSFERRSKRASLLQQKQAALSLVSIQHFENRLQT